MDRRYAEGTAYRITTLWDRVRDEELVGVTVELLGKDRTLEELSVLDIGCGTGGIAASVDRCRELIGLELSDVAVEQARCTYGHRPEVSFRQMDAQDLRFPDERFDAAVAREVLEHLPDAGKCVREAFRVLRPGGVFVVTSPNRDSLHLRINRALEGRDFVCSGDHLREYSFREMCDVLRDSGFAIEESRGVFCMPYWGVPGLDEHVRKLTDDDPAVVEMLRELGRRVGPEYAFCYAIVARKPEAGHHPVPEDGASAEAQPFGTPR